MLVKQLVVELTQLHSQEMSADGDARTLLQCKQRELVNGFVRNNPSYLIALRGGLSRVAFGKALGIRHIEMGTVTCLQTDKLLKAMRLYELAERTIDENIMKDQTL